MFNAPASALAYQTWISTVGNDANPCTLAAPCQTFQAALSKTIAGGEIDCLDNAVYGLTNGTNGSVTITKAIAIICDNANDGLSPPVFYAFDINVPAGTYVTLSGMFIDGQGSTAHAGYAAIHVIQGGNIVIRNMKITGSRGGYAVDFEPSATASLILDNVTITESGLTQYATTGGVLVRPAAGVTATMRIDNSRIQNNNNIGVRFDTVGIVGSTINATIDNSFISNNTNGVLAKAPAGTGTINLLVKHSRVEENSDVGLVVNGAGSVVRVTNSFISQNGTGLMALSNGILASYGNNVFDGNGVDGGVTTTLRMQ